MVREGLWDVGSIGKGGVFALCVPCVRPACYFYV